MEMTEVLDKARDTIGVRRVYGEPIERDGTLVIPAAVIGGGGGGGSGTDGEGQGGEGGGFGIGGRPVGAYVVRDGDVRWEPAIDVTRIVGLAASVLIALVVARMLVARARAKSGRRQPE